MSKHSTRFVICLECDRKIDLHHEKIGDVVHCLSCDESFVLVSQPPPELDWLYDDDELSQDDELDDALGDELDQLLQPSHRWIDRRFKDDIEDVESWRRTSVPGA